jgi:hypothetical protein
MLKKFHLHEQPIAEGHRLYEEGLEAMGVSHRRDDAMAFCKAKGQWLEFEPEPSNKHDPHAIRLVGCWRGFFGTKRRHVGYVPRETATRLHQLGLVDATRPRLLKTYVGHDNFVEIEFQITGPSEKFREYKPLTDAPWDQLKKLKQEGRLDEAEALLMTEVTKTEAEAKAKGFGVAPWAYRELALLYRKQKRLPDEIAILERYDAQPKAPGKSPAELAERLNKARELSNNRATG